jgi:uncharacterized pyridoxamine 5'-phosphate oxidase family protein
VKVRLIDLNTVSVLRLNYVIPENFQNLVGFEKVSSIKRRIAMEKILTFLKEAGTFYLATDEGGQPRVRPLGFVMLYEGKLTFCTNNTKPMWKQMKANTKVEIWAVSKDMKTLRITGTVSFVTSPASQKKALETAPMLSHMYSAGDGIFEIFNLKDGVAIFSDMTGGREEVKL